MKRSENGVITDARIRVFDHRNVVRLDWGLLLLVVVLAAVGILTLVSASRSISSVTPVYLKQVVFFGMGLGVAVFIGCLDHRFLTSIAPMAYAGAVGLLVAVLLLGTEAKGGLRWLSLGPFNLQPSEPSKLAVILFLAWYLSTIGQKVRKLHYFLLAFVIVAVPGFLILAQPSLGTAATLGPVVFAMLYVAGCRRRHLAAIVALAIVAAPLAWGRLEEYQQRRLMTFLDPSADPQGSGYHTLQSMITVGSGGFTGKGYFQGTQTPLSYLPEHHTDFIFSLLAEEWGFAGTIAVIVLYGLLLLRGLSFAKDCSDLGGALMAVGIVALLTFHIFVNIAITLGIMPVTGIPLPFLSYGGSFYLTIMMCVGVLLSVHIRRGMFDH